MGLQKVITEDRRLCILRLLAEQKDYSLNLSLLSKALYHLGHGVGYDMVAADVAWLESVTLLKSENISGSVTVAKITRLGKEVAAGTHTVPGVERPGPGE
ncbi:hypothetical protein [Paremcibacter congregatus]|uniref:VpaChn25_0724 family phage protein n=1 Tax=Paremcibacter congregatus TaxID=2043170 RepID=UPI0030ED9A21